MAEPEEETLEWQLEAMTTKADSAMSLLETANRENSRLRDHLQTAVGALADIAFANDMDERMRRTKARRIYNLLKNAV